MIVFFICQGWKTLLMDSVCVCVICLSSCVGNVVKVACTPK